MRGHAWTWSEIKKNTHDLNGKLLSDGTISRALKFFVGTGEVLYVTEKIYVCVEDLALLEGKVDDIFYRQITIRLIDRMRADELEKTDVVKRARREFIPLCIERDKATEAAEIEKNKATMAAHKKQRVEELVAQGYPQGEAEQIYEQYIPKSERRMRSDQQMKQDAEKLAEILMSEDGEKIKKKVASALSRMDGSGAYNLHLIYRDLGI